MYLVFLSFSLFMLFLTMKVIFLDIKERKIKKKIEDNNKVNEARHRCPYCNLSYTTFVSKSKTKYLFFCNDCKKKYLTDWYISLALAIESISRNENNRPIYYFFW